MTTYFPKTLEPITLPLGSTAEPDTCGSCKFFKRADAASYPCNQDRGWCRFVLPPMMQKFVLYQYKSDEEGDGWGPRARNDTERCDCQVSDGKNYIVQRLILAVKP